MPHEGAGSGGPPGLDGLVASGQGGRRKLRWFPESHRSEVEGVEKVAGIGVAAGQGPRLNFVSMNLRTDVWSWTTLDT